MDRHGVAAAAGPGEPADTFFLGPAPTSAPSALDVRDPRNRNLFRLDDWQMDLDKLRKGAPSEQPTVSASMATALLAYSGIAVKMLVDQRLDAQLHTMFMVEYQPGGVAQPHDHPFEESYYMLEGEVDVVADGERYTLRPGDVFWTGVGCIHAFYNTAAATCAGSRRPRRGRPTATRTVSTATGSTSRSGSSMFAHRSISYRERLRRRKLQALELARLQCFFALPIRILFEHDRRRIDDHDAMITVDDDEIVLTDQRARVLHADRCGNAKAARDDRRMRRAAAQIRDEALEGLPLELHHVGGRDVVRDHDHFVAASVNAVDEPARRARQRLSTRSTTCSISALRSRRYSSSTSSKWRREDVRAVRSAPTRRCSGACG